MASTSGLQEIFKKKVSLGPAPEGDIREHVHPVREVSHQGSIPCAVQVLGGKGQHLHMGLDKLFHCVKQRNCCYCFCHLYLRAPESCREAGGESAIPPRDFSPSFHFCSPWASSCLCIFPSCFTRSCKRQGGEQRQAVTTVKENNGLKLF